MSRGLRRIFERNLDPLEDDLEHEIIRDREFRRRILRRLRALERAANISYEHVRRTAREQERQEDAER